MPDESSIGSKQPKEKDIDSKQKTNKHTRMSGYNIFETGSIKYQRSKTECKKQDSKIY